MGLRRGGREGGREGAVAAGQRRGVVGEGMCGRGPRRLRDTKAERGREAGLVC